VTATAALIPGRRPWSSRGVGLIGSARALLVAGVAWGAFAFGAVYPWAYWPLAIVAAAVALAGMVTPAAIRWRALDLTALTLALGIFLAAAAAQLVPLPAAAIRTISPATLPVAAQLDLTAQLDPDAARPVTIDPPRTRRGLVVIASLAALVVGAARLFSIVGAAGTAWAVVILGVLLALTGIIQRPLSTGKIYGFWTPLQGGSPFGPFVNKNHFAGWMLMAIPVVIGLLCHEVSRGLRGVRPGWRERLMWLSSPDASRLLLLIGAAALMTLSLFLTMSRSGMAAGALAIVCVGLASRHAARGKKIAALAIVSALLVLAIGWVGAATIASRFSSADARSVNGRTLVWKDAIEVVRRYPIAGTGLNTYSVAMIFYQRFNKPTRYSQAHNDYLQLAAEGGLLLTLPAAIAIVMFIRVVRRRFAHETSASTYWIRRGAVVGLLAIALQEIVEFSLQMPGNAFLFAVLCAIALHRTPSLRP
jgi:O-antigen ligase/polysaccharide polymerase Wzy-like membrane protein